VRIHVYEYITGGGLIDSPLPASLAREGELMLAALLADLAAIPGVEITVARDPRLPCPARSVRWMYRSRDEPPLAAFRREIQGADAVWPIAPETGGALQELALVVHQQDKILLASSPEAIHSTASKSLTAKRLHEHGITVAQTFGPHEELPRHEGRWVIKPDDGAGCVDTLIVDGAAAARAALRARGAGFIAQPWIEGDALSLSLLSQDGHAELLCVNRQHIAIRNSAVMLTGLTVNAVRPIDPHFAALANAICSAIPGLFGYIGADLVLTRIGPIVIEINPRLTTSYVGLRGALGINVAERVLGMACGERLGRLVKRTDTSVELDLGHVAS
jgi:predicted ATP-grasp superfamily ATP-dependent carboligase